MECNDCNYCYKTYHGRCIWFCCYGKDGVFSMNYTPGLIDGDIPEWCPYRTGNIKETEDLQVNDYKIVTVKHPNCNTPYTFSVPERLELDAGDYVLCDTKTHNYPQVAQCITPSFTVSEDILKELLNISPTKLRPIVAHLSVEWCKEEKTEDAE